VKVHPLAAFLFLAVFAALPVIAQSGSSADTIYLHGNILTGKDLTGEHPERVSAMAVAHGVIVGVGDDSTIQQQFRGPSTQITDLHGDFVMPGFNDAHVHLGMAGQIKLSVDLTGTQSLSEMQARIRDAGEDAAPSAWLTGGGWDHTLWPSKTLPTRKDLDSVTGARPAVFSRIDGHIVVANSAALAIAGITRDTPDPQGGKIDRDGHGDPTGIIRETAQSLIDKHIPPPDAGQRMKGDLLALHDAAAHGITSVQDNSNWEDFLVYERVEQRGELPVRVGEWLPFDASVDTLEMRCKAHDPSDRMLHTTMLKGFLDGSLGSRTAALNGPYADDPGNSGIPRYEQQKLNDMAVERARAGFQMGFHAIGDRAVSMALDAFAAAEQSPPRKTSQPLPGRNFPVHNNVRRAVTFQFHDWRNRIEHSQVVDPGDFARYKKLGVIASMQPNHLLTDMSWAEQRLGPERAKGSYAWKSFLDAGVPLAFGTDYPVEPITPFRGVYAAVTRMNEAGTMTYHPEQKITIGQALYAYTQGSAYAEFTEQWKGKLAPGYVADFIVLDRDLTRIAPSEILKTRVLRTVVGGRSTYSAAENPQPQP
jgi:predicted amidohydrolase YtcJ